MGLDFIPTGIATGVSSICGTQVVQNIATVTRFVMPVGVFTVYAVGATTRLQVQDSTGAWQNVTAVGVGVPLCPSDGANFGFYNAGAGTESITYIRIG